MKPVTKNDSWCYTISKSKIRNKVKRHKNKSRRQKWKQELKNLIQG